MATRSLRSGAVGGEAMIVYVCGPLTMGGSELRAEDIATRIEVAELVSAALMLNAQSPIAAHSICRHQMAIDQIPQWLAIGACLELLEKCEAVAVLEGWEKSAGCRQEVDHGQFLGLSFIGPDLQLHKQPVEWTRADALRVLEGE